MIPTGATAATDTPSEPTAATASASAESAANDFAVLRYIPSSMLGGLLRFLPLIHLSSSVKVMFFSFDILNINFSLEVHLLGFNI